MTDIRKKIEERIRELEKRNEDYNKQFERSDYKVLSTYELCNRERIDELKKLLEEEPAILERPPKFGEPMWRTKGRGC